MNDTCHVCARMCITCTHGQIAHTRGIDSYARVSQVGCETYIHV